MKRPNGSGTVFKRGQSWYAQVTSYCIADEVDGVPHRIQRRKTKGGFRTKKEALSYLITLEQEKHRIQAPQLIQLWQRIDKTIVPKLSDGKRKAYGIARKRLDDIIGMRIDELTVEDMQCCIDENATSYYTARDMKTVLSKMYELSIPDRFVQVNLSKYLVLPELEEAEQEPFTQEEVEAMWKAYNDGDYFIGYMLTMIYSGMMPSELLSCKKDMINMERREIVGCGKKTDTRKSVPIVFADCVAPVILTLSNLSETDKLCPHEKTTFYREYHRAIERLGIRYLPPYSCRHTAATEAAKNAVNASAIQQLMRHAKITTTQKYIHIGSAEAHTAAESIFQEKKQINAV